MIKYNFYSEFFSKNISSQFSNYFNLFIVYSSFSQCYESCIFVIYKTNFWKINATNFLFHQKYKNIYIYNKSSMEVLLESFYFQNGKNTFFFYIIYSEYLGNIE